jgi:hypothetical protein
MTFKEDGRPLYEVLKDDWIRVVCDLESFPSLGLVNRIV